MLEYSRALDCNFKHISNLIETGPSKWHFDFPKSSFTPSQTKRERMDQVKDRGKADGKTQLVREDGSGRVDRGRKKDSMRWENPTRERDRKRNTLAH